MAQDARPPRIAPLTVRRGRRSYVAGVGPRCRRNWASYAFPPVSGKTFGVGERDDPDVLVLQHEDDGIWEARHERAARPGVEAIGRE